MPKLVRNKPPAPEPEVKAPKVKKVKKSKPKSNPRLPEDGLIEQAERVFSELDSAESVDQPNDVRSEPETDRTEFDAVTAPTEQASTETLPRGDKAVLKAPVNPELRRPFDDYPTEPGWTQALLDRVRFTGKILEPAAGAGWMVQVLEENGHEVEYSDLERDGVDFLEYDGPQVRNVVTNPPYKFLDAFALQALKVATDKVALLLPDFALVGVNRTRDLWQAFPPAKLILVTSKMKVLGKVSMFPHVWVVWDNDYTGPTTWEWATVPREQRFDTSKAVPNLRSKK